MSTPFLSAARILHVLPARSLGLILGAAAAAAPSTALAGHRDSDRGDRARYERYDRDDHRDRGGVRIDVDIRKERREPVYGWVFHESWFDIGNHEQLLEADNRSRIAAGLPPRARYSPE